MDLLFTWWERSAKVWEHKSKTLHLTDEEYKAIQSPEEFYPQLGVNENSFVDGLSVEEIK